MTNIDSLKSQVASAITLASRMVESYRENPEERKRVIEINRSLERLSNQLNTNNLQENDLSRITAAIKTEVAALEQFYYDD